MNILYVSSDTGGCKYYRCDLPGVELHNAGHKVCVTDVMAVTESGEIHASNGTEYTTEISFDVVVMQRWMDREAADVIRAAREFGQVVINDVDDWFFGLPQSNASFANSHPKANTENNREHYKRALAASNAVTVSTPYLAERLRSLGVPVFVLRNALDPQRWPVQETTTTDAPTLGWVGALAFRAGGDLGQLAGVIAPFMAEHDSHFIHVGARSDDPGPLADVLGIDPQRVEVRPFCAMSDLPTAMAGIDVALAPLEDCPFNQAKSAVKVMEASAAGIPFIASDMGEYRWFSDGRAGILCDKPIAWRRALERMCDPEVRAKLSAVGRQRVEEVAIDQTWQSWERCYQRVSIQAGNG